MEDMRITVRKARAADAAAIAELEKECFARPWSIESVLYDLTENEKAVYVVAELAEERAGAAEQVAEGKDNQVDASGTTGGSRICGYAGMWIVAGEGQITNVAVTKTARRMHAATAILDELFELATAKGAESFTLEVRVSNEPAINLYKGFGFREAGVRKGYYEDNGEDALIMWK